MRPVDLIVVTFNSERVIGRLLDSLDTGLGELDWQVHVIDNGSVDRTTDLVRARLPGVRVAVLAGNHGYGAAINRGLAAARPGSDVLILNPDVELAAGAGRALQRCLRGHGSRTPSPLASDRAIGIAAPRTLSGSGSLEPSLRREPSVSRALAEAALGARRAGRWGFGEAVLDPAAYERPTIADWASGSALMVSRECVDACGPWDESFFLYSEDTEYCLRARDRGFLTALTPEATVTHLGGASRKDARLWSLLARNKLTLYRRRHGPARALAFRAAAVLRELRFAATGNRPSVAATRGLLRRGGRA